SPRDRRTQPEADARAGATDGAGRRRDYRRWHFRGVRAPGALRRTGTDAVLRVVGLWVRVRGAMLRRVRGHDSPGRERVHLCIRDVGRAVCLDYRMGPDTRVCDGREHSVFGLVETLRSSPERL